MKSSLFPLILCWAFWSCSPAESGGDVGKIYPAKSRLAESNLAKLIPPAHRNDSIKADTLSGKLLRLVKFSDGIGPPIMGNAMPYQQLYAFLANNRFTKIRIEGKDSAKVGGTYAFQLTSDDPYLALNFSSANETLIESCTSTAAEFLWIRKDTVQQTANACDWPSEQYTWSKK